MAATGRARAVAIESRFAAFQLALQLCCEFNQHSGHASFYSKRMQPTHLLLKLANLVLRVDVGCQRETFDWIVRALRLKGMSYNRSVL